MNCFLVLCSVFFSLLFVYSCRHDRPVDPVEELDNAEEAEAAAEAEGTT